MGEGSFLSPKVCSRSRLLPRLPGTAGAGLIEVLVLALVTVVARLVTLPAVANVSVVRLLPAQAVSPWPGLPLQLPAEHFLHIYRGQSPGGGEVRSELDSGLLTQ